MFSVVSRWIWGLVASPPLADDNHDANDQRQTHGTPPNPFPPTLFPTTAVPPVPFPPIDLDHHLHVPPDGLDDSGATVDSAFFQRLPPDIRRLVLIEAFGCRGVHVDLRYDLPLALDSRTHGRNDKFPEAPMTRDWRWYSCVCHQGSPWCAKTRSGVDDSVSKIGKDRCIKGDTGQAQLLCDFWRSEEPLERRVGAMGWLRTCRRAYVEGIEILYGTNEFLFSGASIFQSFERPLLRPEHLSLIKSAEIVFDLGRVARPPDDGRDFSHDKRFSGWYQFISILNTVPKALPNLRFLHLSPSGTWFPPQMARNDIIRLTKTVFLDPFDTMIEDALETNPRLEYVHLSVPAAMAAASGADAEGAHSIRAWRAIIDKRGNISPEKEKLGYWISSAPHGRQLLE